jgi:predicted amidohydrolase YtcJ
VTSADVIITDAMIYTGDVRQPTAEAMAIGDDWILAVGSEAECRSHAGASTRILSMHERFVMPGFVDVHNHHSEAGKADLLQLTFAPTETLDGILAAVSDYARQFADNAWILGGSWGSGLMTQLATDAARSDLDRAAGGRPVLLSDDSKHNRWASTRALEIAGITAESVDPPGGQILHDPESGEPSGVMLEAAGRLMELAISAEAKPDAEQQRACSRRGIEILHGYGVTGFQDAAASADIMAALKSLDDAGQLDAWVVSSMVVNDPIFGFDPVGEALLDLGAGYRTEHHRPDFVKIFLDGVPPARTAAFLEPYLPNGDTETPSGAPSMSDDELVWWLRRTARDELSAKIHCTGDRSVRMVLDAVAQVRAEGFSKTRYHIAHGQFVHPDDIPRFAELGVVADISPFLWVPGVIPAAISEVLPGERARRMQPNRDLLDSGALVAGGSDWPVSESPNALEGIAGLVTRRDPTHTFSGALWPEQAVSPDEAIRIFTLNGAKAMGLGDVTGSLISGKSADFVVLDQDITAIEPESIAKTKVDQTWFAGDVMYSR